jgi:hydroxyacylglutathione hydrolase
MLPTIPERSAVPVTVHTLAVGPLQTNCYLFVSDGEAAVIDAAAEPQRILAAAAAANATIRLLANTHAHLDHTGAIAAVQATTGAPAYLHPDDLPLLLGGGLIPAGSTARVAEPLLSLAALAPEPPSPPEPLADGQHLEVGSSTLEVIHTPGHTPGGVCFYCAAASILFSGDTLFHLGVGRADLPGSNGRQMLEAIKRRLFTLPDDTLVYPGHGPSTTIGLEKRRNPFVRPSP